MNGGGGVHNMSQFKLMSWNIEGLSEIKEMEIVDYMSRFGIDVCCLQETRKSKSDVYMSNGAWFILSGGDGDSTEWHGVGFVISRRFKQHIRGFCQVNNRIASLKIHCSGGTFAVITVLAPHNLRPQDEKWNFYDQLSNVMLNTSTNGPKLIFGDLNARLGQARPGEQHIVGPHSFGVEARHQVEMPNRDFLLELCRSHRLGIANTFCDVPVEKKVTYHEPSVPPLGPISPNSFTMLDLLLIPQDNLTDAQGVYSDRLATLASGHFPVTALLHVEVLQRQPIRTQVIRRDWTVLQNPDLRRAISQSISTNMSDVPVSNENEYWEKACSVMASAIASLIPVINVRANKPWISSETLELLRLRREARLGGQWDREKQLRAEVKRSAKRDRARWLEDLASSGDWKCLRRLRRGRPVKQGRLRDRNGDLVSSDLRAETLAEHLEQVQWRVRPTTLVADARAPLGETLPVNVQNFNLAELRKAISKMANGKATKADDIPIEVFKALAVEPDPSLQWLLNLCNHCWQNKVIPHEWSTASVAMLFKKGDPADANNYRPICLQSIAYKLFASLLKQRFLDAGAESRLWQSQFGFRKGRCTEDAIYVALRKVEQACARRNGQTRLLALDWKKAFDSINLASLLDALRRFGLPEHCLNMIAGMMRHRRFYVEDQGVKSATKSQQSGISQGCTLSPLLFIMTMTVLMHDAVTSLGESSTAAYRRGDLADIVYADDTLLLASCDHYLQEFLGRVADAGRLYGMELHWDKFQLLQVQCHASISTPTGESIAPKQGIDYLGTVLSHDGLPGHELGRRIGMAKADFLNLQKVWKHSSLHWTRKVEIFKALIESKLMYSLSCLCLSAVERRRLDGFHSRCLRCILGIPPAFISRVSNAEVRRRARCHAATDMLLQHQLHLFGKAYRSPWDSPMHFNSFIPGTLQPITDAYVRRVGRPRREWITETRNKAFHFLGGHCEITRLVQNPVVWHRTVGQLLPVHAPPGV